MKELNQRDIRLLTRTFLDKLNDEVNGNEDKCVESTKIFESTGLKAFSQSVIPFIIQELVSQDLIKKCNIEGEVKITRKGKQRLSRTIENNAYSILETIANKVPNESGRSVMHNSELQSVLLDLKPGEINDAVEILKESGLLDVKYVVGTYPYTFYNITLTPRGRYEFQRQSIGRQFSSGEEIPKADKKMTLRSYPAGSPFGFTDIDWEIVIKKRNVTGKLYVVLGHKFQSTYYDSEELKKNIQNMFQQAIDGYRLVNPNLPSVELVFKVLSAGYGQHLFNEIVRDIISSDIAVFEASDLNPNVMIEIGVSLTWGIRTLIIRERKSPIPPSDISGQTWAAYSNSGLDFDSDHKEKLASMVELVMMKKYADQTV